jgi:hypothetical protein
LRNFAIIRVASLLFSTPKEEHDCLRVPRANHWLDVQTAMPQLKLALKVNSRARVALFSGLKYASNVHRQSF